MHDLIGLFQAARGGVAALLEAIVTQARAEAPADASSLHALLNNLDANRVQLVDVLEKVSAERNRIEAGEPDPERGVGDRLRAATTVAELGAALAFMVEEATVQAQAALDAEARAEAEAAASGTAAATTDNGNG